MYGIAQDITTNLYTHFYQRNALFKFEGIQACYIFGREMCQKLVQQGILEKNGNSEINVVESNPEFYESDAWIELKAKSIESSQIICMKAQVMFGGQFFCLLDGSAFCRIE